MISVSNWKDFYYEDENDMTTMMANAIAGFSHNWLRAVGLDQSWWVHLAWVIMDMMMMGMMVVMTGMDCNRDDDDGGDKTSRSGNPFHMLHHSAFDCNYGNAQVKPNPAQYVQSLS